MLRVHNRPYYVRNSVETESNRHWGSYNLYISPRWTTSRVQVGAVQQWAVNCNYLPQDKTAVEKDPSSWIYLWQKVAKVLRLRQPAVCSKVFSGILSTTIVVDASYELVVSFIYLFYCVCVSTNAVQGKCSSLYCMTPPLFFSLSKM